MTVGIEINNSPAAAARYVTWGWSRCRIRVTNPAGLIGPVATVQLSQTALAGGGSIRFSATGTGAGSASLTVPVPANGTSVQFFVRGMTASNADPGVRIVARWQPPLGALTQVGRVNLMVRVRKNAVNLSTGERDRFLRALGTLNNQGLGRYADFRAIHVSTATSEAHGAPGFLPWHRTYILDLERELQAIDPSVALPYWRFDQPAPSLFTPDYLGQPNGNNPVIFSPGHPLLFWQTDGTPGIVRNPQFNTAGAPPAPLSQASVLALGLPGPNFANFRRMEAPIPPSTRDGHGSAHTSFTGPIRSIGSAARDPLFFLLHCNVDRLWALWQRQNGLFDSATAAAFETPAPPATNRAGHNLADTMWPWNGVTVPPRPPFTVGGTMAPSPCVARPGNQPRVRDCFDYQGSVNVNNSLGYSYDDIPL